MPPLKIEIKPIHKVLDEVEADMRAIKRGEPLESSRTLSFETVDDFRSFFTEKRLEIIKAIRRHHPKSVYELAKILKRDLKSVRTDLKKLIILGVVSTRRAKANTPKGYKSVPHVEFDRMVLEIAV